MLTAVVVGVRFTALVRRRDPGQRGFAMLVGGVLFLTLVSLLQADRFLGVASIALVTIVVVIPRALDLAVRACFSRERLAWAVGLARVRTMLMPGAGLGRQQEILEGLSLLERKGVDGAIAHFRALLQRTEDEDELCLLHEQIVSMLLYGQRWSEGIAHYEARFAPSYAAQRPPLALGLLRAYGESGKLDDAATLLRSIERRLGPIPRAAGVVSQARLTFLAYVGEAKPVHAALTEPRRRRLGLSAASVALFQGIALSRAGQPDAASAELRRVADVARSRDERVVLASRKAIAALPGDAVELEPELHHYADAVADRLETFFAATPATRRTGPLRVTPLLITMLVAAYLARVALDGGGLGLLAAGAATPALVMGGSFLRLLSGLSLAVDGFSALLAAYGVWLAGPLVERVLGRGRLIVASLGAGAVGLAVACVSASDPYLVLDGSGLLTTGVATAALFIVGSSRTDLPRRTRWVLALPLLLLLVAMALSITRSAGIVFAPAGMLAAAAIGGLSVVVAPPRGALAKVLRWSSVPIVVLFAASVVWVAVEDPRTALREHGQSRHAAGVQFDAPGMFGVVHEVEDDRRGLWPLVPGLVDNLAQQAGDRVQVVVTTVAADDDSRSALLRIEPDLAHDLVEVSGEAPVAWRQAYNAVEGRDAARDLRVTTLRRNGDDIGLVVERALGDASGAPTIVLIAAPPAALEHAPELYAEILGGAMLDDDPDSP